MPVHSLARAFTDPTGKGALMSERLNSPQEAYNFKLGAALRMEQTVLEMLETTPTRRRTRGPIGCVPD
jgi:hypothetical protein